MASRGSSRWRLETWGQPCQPTLVTIPIYAGGPKISVNRLARDSFLQLGLVFQRHGYIVRRAGCYNCRQITGGTSNSSHSWAISVDVNDDTNPYRTDKLVTDMSREMIRDVYAIKTVDGVQVFRWGGDWDGRSDTSNSNYDAMHFEIIAAPENLAKGFPASVPQPRIVTVPKVSGAAWPVLRRGTTGPAVLELQRRLGMTGITGTGTFGPRTETAVITYQHSRGLPVDGIVGASTWTALLSSQPPIKVGEPGPLKRFS